MNKLYKNLFIAVTFLLLLTVQNIASAIDYVSNASNSWTVTTTWTPNGTPGSGDNVTISAGHAITVSTTTHCKNLTVTGTGTITVTSNFNIWGDFANAGTLNGSGSTSKLFFRTAGKTISGAGSFDNGGDWRFQANQTITSTTVSKAAGNFIVNGGVTVTNSGSVTLSTGTVNFSTGTSTWTNAAGSSLTVYNQFSGAGVLNASASVNTVAYSGNVSPNIFIPSGSQYNNLTLNGGGTKTMQGNLIIGGTLTVGSAGTTTTLDVAGYSLTIRGNLTTAGTTPTINNTGAVTFDGSSGAQVISGTISTFTCSGTFTINNASGVSCSNDIMIKSSTSLTAGTFSNSTTTTFNGSSAQTITGTSGDLSCKELTISNSAGVSSSMPVAVTGTTTLTSGVFTINSTLTFNGSSAQTITGTSGSITCSSSGSIDISNASGVTTSRSFTIAGSITASSGTFTTGSTPIYLTSVAGITGTIGDCSGGDISGSKWFMERYIASADTGWQDISSPITGADISSWDSTLSMSMASGCPDGMSGGWNSVYYWDASTQAYVAVTNCSEALSVGKGFEIWLASTTSTFVPTGTTRTIGTPTVGSKTVTVGSALGQFSLIGNPYQSTLDWAALATDNPNVKDYFSVYDESLHNYATWDCTSGPCSGTGNVVSGDIPPYQGLWVENANGTSDFTFNEAQKIASSTELIKQAKPLEINLLRIKIRADFMPNAHESLLRFKQGATDDNDGFGDVTFRQSRDPRSPSITALSGDNYKLTVATFPYDNPTKDITLIAYIGVAGEYMIDFKNINLLDAYNCIVLEDKENGRFYPIKGDHTYSFKHQTAGTEHKFILHLSRKSASNCNNAGINNINLFPSESGINASFNNDSPLKTIISVCNVLGQEVLTKTVYPGKETILLDLERSNNIYLIKFTTSEGTITKKIMY